MNYKIKKHTTHTTKKTRKRDVRCITEKQIGKDGMYHCVYIIQHKRSGCFYIGSKSSKDPDFLFKSYFTSSSVVKNIIKVDGVDSFKKVKIYYLRSRAEANQLENKLIFLNNTNDSLNKAFTYNNTTIIKDWEPVEYKGVFLKIDPTSPLLNLDFVASPKHKKLKFNY